MVLNVADKIIDPIPDNEDGDRSKEVIEHAGVAGALGGLGVSAARALLDIAGPTVEKILDKVSGRLGNDVDNNPRRYW